MSIFYIKWSLLLFEFAHCFYLHSNMYNYNNVCLYIYKNDARLYVYLYALIYLRYIDMFMYIYVCVYI